MFCTPWVYVTMDKCGTFARVDDLNGGQEALEERARNELSMTRPGETFYRLVPDASKRAQSAGQNNR